MLHFDLKDLRVFTAVALAGSITRAAEYVHLSPSAASDRLADLEKRLGIRLYRRGPRGMRLTEAGEVFEKAAKRILLEAEQLESQLSPFAYASEKRLRIFCNYNAAVSFLPQRIGRFLSLHPDVQVDILQVSSPDVVKQVASGEGDLGITAYAGSHPLLEFMPFATDCLVGVVPHDNPLAERGTIASSELFPYNYIGVGPYSPMQDFLNKRAEEEGKTIRPRVVASSHDAVMSLVAEGAGVSVLPSGVVPKTARVASLLLEEPWSIRRLRLCRRRDRSTYSDEQRALLDAFIGTLLPASASPHAASSEGRHA